MCFLIHMEYIKQAIKCYKNYDNKIKFLHLFYSHFLWGKKLSVNNNNFECAVVVVKSMSGLFLISLDCDIRFILLMSKTFLLHPCFLSLSKFLHKMLILKYFKKLVQWIFHLNLEKFPYGNTDMNNPKLSNKNSNKLNYSNKSGNTEKLST